VDSYRKIALDWLADHPEPESITTDPARWSEQTAEAIRQRIRDLVDQLAPANAKDGYSTRVGRLNAAELSARELAIEEHLPGYPTADDQEHWAPLVPDISDLL
jgi:hypothetical protein